MGKGDKKTKRGKITIGTYGVHRPKKKANAFKPKVEKKEVGVVKEEAPKKAAPKKTTAKKTTTKKAEPKAEPKAKAPAKSTAKKTTAKKTVKKEEVKKDEKEKEEQFSIFDEFNQQGSDWVLAIFLNILPRSSKFLN